MGFWRRLFGGARSSATRLESLDTADLAALLAEGIAWAGIELAWDLQQRGRLQIDFDEAAGECVIALFHFLDRKTFEVLGPAKRDAYVDAAIKETSNSVHA